MQGTTNFPSDDNEARYSGWVAKLRKDVECTFGILKKRFRVLKLTLFFKDMRDIDHVFVTCCILHNILLDHRFSLNGGWEGEESPPPRYRDPLTRGWALANDATNYFRLTPEWGVRGGDDEEEVSAYYKWRDRYITNYNQLLRRSQIAWPGPVETNPSMSTPLPE